jgi:insulysin
MLKSDYDTREYTNMILDNGLKVVIVRDKDITQSGATMLTHLGSIDDGKFMGLAHFLEHLLFMGSHKYPGENDYGKFLAEHGGGSNAYTADDHTCYYFGTNSDSFYEALDIFSRFFIDPLLDESAISREINAVNSEFQMYSTNDSWRMQALSNFLGNPNNPCSKFTVGNLDTLQKDGIFNAVKELHAKYYSSNIMYLCVVHNDTIENIKTQVLNMFGQMQNKHVNIVYGSTTDTTETNGVLMRSSEQFYIPHMRKILTTPTKDRNSIKIVWTVPTDTNSPLVSQNSFLAHLIGHEGVGSILQLLKDNGWATALLAGCAKKYNLHENFAVNIMLTKLGIEHTEEIINIVYSYVNILKSTNENIMSVLYDDYVQLDNIKWIFKSNHDALNTSVSIANKMFNHNNVSLNEILALPLLHKKWDEMTYALISSTLSCMTYENSDVIICSKMFSDEMTHIVDYFLTPYGIKELERPIEKVFDLLQLPVPNKFIPLNTSMIKKIHPIKMAINSHNGMSAVWYNPLTTYGLPKASITAMISLDNMNDKKFVEVIKMFTSYTTRKLSTVLYDAELLHYGASITTTSYGMELHVSGFTDKLGELIAILINELNSTTVDKVIFDNCKEHKIKALSNVKYETPYRLLSDIVESEINPIYCSHDEQLLYVQSMETTDLEQFLLLLKKIQMTLFFGGNISPTLVETICSNIVTMTTTQLSLQPFFDPNEYITNMSGTIVRECFNEKETNSAISVIYPIGYLRFAYGGLNDDYYNEAAKITILNELISEEFFNSLRTQDQLGYVTNSSTTSMGKAFNPLTCQRFLIQSPIAKGNELKAKINEFVINYVKTLEEIPEESFMCIKDNVAKSLCKKDENMNSELSKVISLIEQGIKSFDHIEKLALCVLTITKSSLIEFYEKYFIDNDSPIVVIIDSKI